MINYKKFVENSRKWLSQYIKNNHLQSICIGISGGIDSTVSCVIVKPVCDALNIPLIGRSLPCHSNNPEEINSANLVGQAFCTDYKEVAIEKLYAQTADMFELNEGKLTKLQLGNIKARIRMNYLRNLASIHKGVVLDNDNFTEWNLGFWTVGGDSPMDINLGLHYLWKTEVYELANYLLEELDAKIQDTYKDYGNNLAEEQFEALSESIKLIPTDGNGVMAGGDCAQFGLDNYNQVDDVLKTMYYSDDLTINCDMHPEYIRLIDSYNEQGVDKVMSLHQSSEFKRQPSPICPTKEKLGL